MVLLVLDATRNMNDFEEKLLEDVKNYKTIVVLNKDDIVQEPMIRVVEKKLVNFPVVRVSAKYGTHIDRLKKLIFKDIVLAKGIDAGPGVTPNLRQRKLLEKTIEELKPMAGSVGTRLTIDIVAGRLKSAIDCLGMLSGKREQEDLYDHIFRNFCVGK